MQGLAIFLVTGSLVPAVWSDENIEISTYVPVPGSSIDGARMTRSVAQSIPNNTPTKIMFNAEAFDIGDIANPATGRFTVKKAGMYLITGSWWLSLSGEEQIAEVYIYVNGAPVKKSRSVHGSLGTQDISAETTDVLMLAVNDTVEMYVLQTRGNSNTTYPQSDYQPRMAVIQLQ